MLEPDYIKALEKAADKHAHRQPRTVNPVALSVSLGVSNFTPQNAQEAAPASKEEKDYLLGQGVDTSQIKSSGEAQQLIGKLRLREQLGLASPKVLGQLTLHLHWPPEKAALLKAKHAGVIVWKRIRYKEPAKEVAVVDGR